MPDSAELVRLAQSGIASRALREVAAIWPKVAGMPPDKTAAVMAGVLEDIGLRYGTASASLAADYYDELRSAAAVAGSFTASPAAMPDSDRYGVLSRWGVGPLFGAEPSTALALSLLTGGLSRIVLDAGRDTIANATSADPAGPKFARHASANACAFCGMLASRGAVYTSAARAATVGGRGTDLSTNIGRTRGRRAKGIRARGTQSLGSKYHDSCHCTVVPVWPGQTYQPAPYVQKWSEAYQNAPAPALGSGGAIDLQDTLASMREQLGSN